MIPAFLENHGFLCVLVFPLSACVNGCGSFGTRGCIHCDNFPVSNFVKRSGGRPLSLRADTLGRRQPVTVLRPSRFSIQARLRSWYSINGVPFRPFRRRKGSSSSEIRRQCDTRIVGGNLPSHVPSPSPRSPPTRTRCSSNHTPDNFFCAFLNYYYALRIGSKRT